jgi:hypothetical protein
MPSCGVQQLFWTWSSSEIDISQMAGDIYRPRGRVESRTRKFNASASFEGGSLLQLDALSCPICPYAHGKASRPPRDCLDVSPAPLRYAGAGVLAQGRAGKARFCNRG